MESEQSVVREPIIESQQLNRLTRYFHTGIEQPKYFPGCWTTHKYFEVDKLNVVDEILQQDKNNIKIVEVIVKAFKDGWFTRYDTIAFALTKCLLHGGPLVKAAAYKAVAQICKSSEQLMLFTKYTRLLKTGNGQGWCKSVRTWYLSKDPMDLAKEITRVKARYGRSHKTLIRKSHLKVEVKDHARDAVVKYVIYGLKRAKVLMAKKDGIEGVFDYIQSVEDMRHCEDPLAAAAMAVAHKFTLEHVPGHLLTSQAVWNAVLPQFSLEQILDNIQRLHNMGFFVTGSPTTTIIISILKNKSLIKKSKVTPIHVYITLANYKKCSRPLKHVKAKVALEKLERRRTRQTFDATTGLWTWNVSRRHPKELKHWGIDQPANPGIVNALKLLLDETWLLTPATGARYLITMDMRHHMFKGRHFCKTGTVLPKKLRKTNDGNPAPLVDVAPPTAAGDANTPEKSKKHLFAECFYNKHVTPGHAALLMALQILKREKNVKLAVFTDESIQFVVLERNFCNIDEAEFIFRQSNSGRVQLDAPIKWATSACERVDVFINMVDRTSRYMELDRKDRGGRGPGARFGPPPTDDTPDRCPVRALEKYRLKCVKNAKLVVMNLASHRVNTTDGSHEGVLDIVGIDEHVPKVLDAFVLGQFK